MAAPTDDPDMPPGETIEPLSRAIGERYLTYALSTITHRALPDARDGLKPVHRRILYAMRGLRLDPTGAFRKCAKIVGEVMGNYHPHGDQAIYDALARLAQDFNVRYPLVDGQGNFGNIDGDNPAAQRYTEARLTAAAAALMEGLAEDAVDFRDNYDGSEREPVVLPAAFPNLLANGSSGIAVGMATNIPPHNIDELVGACLHLVKHPNASDEKLLDFVRGPDFPTGGVCVEPRAAIGEAYRTGRGGFRLRARWGVEDLGRGAWQIVVTEIPYQVQKGRLIERIAELVTAKKLPILADVRDESAEDLRIVLEPRARTVDPNALMETLFRATDLETRFAMNMTVLIDGRTPVVASLRQALRAFLDHRREVLLRRARHRLEKIDARLEILDGLIVAYLNLDRIIAIIRSEDEPKPVIAAEFALTDAQAEAILSTRLRALRRLEEMELRAERDALLAERAWLAALLGAEALQWDRVAEELREARRAFGKAAPGGARRTDFAAAPEVEEVGFEAMVEREPVTVVLSAMGWIRALRGHLGPEAELKFRDGDGPGFLLHAETTDRLLLMASNGRMFTLAAGALPGGRGLGEPVRLLVDLPNEAQPIALRPHRPGGRLLLASDAGDGFLLPEDEALAQTRAGRQVMNLAGAARARVCRRAAGDHAAVVGANRKLLVFPLADLPEMGRGKGVRLQRYKDGGLSDATTFTLAEGLAWLDPAGRTRTVGSAELADWIGPRASAGRMAPRGFPQTNRFD
jgi:topoisomerase-4 subunit A